MHIHLSDQYRAGHSPLHHLDPRVKVISVLAFILALSLLPEGSWGFYLAALGTLLLVAWISGLGWSFALRRSYIALPFVLAALALPFTVPGETILELPGLGWRMSAEGLSRFLTILIRSWLAIQAALMLTASTRFADLLWSLQALKVPSPLVSIGSFMYRYLFVLADEALRMTYARRARSASPGIAAERSHWPLAAGAGLASGRRPSIRWKARVSGGMVGSLFLRAWDRAERVYAAMAARGYDGRARPRRSFRMRRLDWLALGFALAGLTVGMALSAAF